MRGGVGSASDHDPGNRGAPAWVAAVAAVVVLVLGGIAFAALQDRAAAAAEAEADAAAARTALQLRAALTQALVVVDTDALDPAVDTVRLDADGAITGGETDRPEVLGSRAAGIALARARDSGAMVISAPASDDGTVVVVRARYAAPGEAPGAMLRSVGQRRAALSGFSAGVVDVASLLPPDELGARRVTDGETVLVPFAGARTDVGEADVAVLDRRWVVAAPVPAAATAAAWWVAALAAVAAGLVVAASWGWRRRDRAREAAAARVDERADAVVTYAGVVQDSHDLAQVVPAIAVQVADRLDLAGLSLSVATELGVSRDVFTYGDAPDPAVQPAAALPHHVGAGETVAVHLRRAERSIGILRFRTGRELTGPDLDQIRIAAELVTSTVVTATALEQQQDAVERLRVLDDLKNTFLGTASHELRTPVTAIAGFSFMLSERWDALSDHDRRVFAERIASNARALEALVQDLLDFARMERGDMKLILEPVDVSVVAGRVIDRLEPVWSSHVIERDLRSDAVVVADVAALERIVTNLVSNAVKFSPAGSAVRVTVDRDGDDVRLLVDDRGPGVPVEERERIFVRFFRGGGEAVVRTSGVGIGLAVVKDFVTQMGGSIAVADGPEGGARFAVRLPVHETVVEQEEAEGAATS